MIAKLGMALGLGLLTVACSEMWFYHVDLTLGIWEVWLFYGIAAYLMIAMMRLYRVGWPGAVVAVGLFGIVIEGVVVPVLYEAVPFSILWTSLAWHGLLTIGCGLFGFRAVARRPVLAVPVFAVAGLLLGVWLGFMWVAEQGQMDVARLSLQVVLAYGMFIGGHMIVDRVADRPWVPTRGDLVVLWGLVLAVWGLMWALPLFPVSLVLPLLIALSWWAMARGESDAPWDISGAVPWAGYGASLVLPVAIIGGAVTTGGVIPEVNAWWILATGPVAAILWLWALGRLALQRG
ncbi:hypothetical protein AB3Y40_12440 [Yoonia sp. R2331]|uniref:hypothetical protein n=1 Tax=Yoonia sp. R2331 TaxID=3237238 RepID=UPI0034E50C46